MADSRPRCGFSVRLTASASTQRPMVPERSDEIPAASNLSEVRSELQSRPIASSQISSSSADSNRLYQRQASRGNYRGGLNRQHANNQSATATTDNRPRLNGRPRHVQIHFSMLTNLAKKGPDETLRELMNTSFPLSQLLDDDRMQSRFDWVCQMTQILEKVATCTEARERIAMILTRIPNTKYVDGLYAMVRERDPISDEFRYDFLQSFLKMAQRLLAIVPNSSADLTKIFERIELLFTKSPSNTPEFTETKSLLNDVLERTEEIDQRSRRNRQQYPTNPSTNNQSTANTAMLNSIRPPPDDYRQLPIVPDVDEIRFERNPFLRPNVVKGIYNNPEHYLDVHFRLLREDFVGPLREGIQQYLFESKSRNFNVRVYENVRVRGARLSPRSGIVYDLQLDPKTAARISWANSRRFLYGNLLLLTYNQFHTCTFVTVDDRSNVEGSLMISVRLLDQVNNAQNIQIPLDDIHFSCPLTMIETTTYFEAYRPILNALQEIPTDETFPLQQYILQLSNASDPPNYVTRNTTFDFTPLLVDPSSNVKAGLVTQERNQRPGLARARAPEPLTTEFRIEYQQANQISNQHKAVPVLNKDLWPTSEQLHLNPKQREALILALTHKVALIQGPPGTGKTFLGVRIAEMLLHNRSVWCPRSEQSTPILMICQTNHALDQFLELIKVRLNLTEGIIRVGNRCQNPAIQPFSLNHARRFARDNRSIPKEIYHQKHAILDRKAQAEENLKYHHAKIAQSWTTILPLTSFVEVGVIDSDHLSSLLEPYNGVPYDVALYEWLGLGNTPVNGLDEIAAALDAARIVDSNDTNGDQKDGLAEGTVTDENDQHPERKENDTAADIDEADEEEELRRQNELDLEDDFRPSDVIKPQRQMDDHSTIQVAGNDFGDDGEGPWQVAGRKRRDYRRLINFILQYPTTLTDQTVLDIQENLWNLPAAIRYDLYRYWLLKYNMICHDAARHGREEYNRAIGALAEYYQDEDYYLLKDSVIVAMTTTGAAKYHGILEKLQSKIVIVEEAAAIFEAHIITALSTGCEHLILIGDHVQLRPSASLYLLAVKYGIEVSLFERLVENKFPNVRLNIQHRMRPEIARLMKHFYDDLEDHESVKTNRPAIRAVGSNLYFINHNHWETRVMDGSSKKNDFEASYVIQLAIYLIKQGYTPQQITILSMYLGQRQHIAQKARNITQLQGLRITVTDNYQGEENDIIILSLVRSNSEKKIGFLKTHNRICVALSRARCGLFIIGNMNLLAEVEEMWKNICQTLKNDGAIGKGLCLSCRQHEKEKFIADTPESFAKRPEGGCDKPCIARLVCGHQCELMCHNYDPEHKEIVCRKKCPTTLNCGHRCSKRCHTVQPDRHDPCRIKVNKTVPGCNHDILFECSQTPKPTDCKELVPKLLPCDHLNRVPCGITSSKSDFRQFLCQELCQTVLACEHRCAGTCGKCRTGRLHIACQAKCERPLICGHVCKDPCSVNCPPCRQKCETRCVHSLCKKKCGEPCVPCKEPCAYKCKHLKCTRLCSEPCNRGPCNEPCDKKLKCGHDCIGICGEPCPTQCRECNKHVVQEIFFGTEDEPDARFVDLPDCKHIIEVTGLDECVFRSSDGANVGGVIRFPECPRCRTPIRRCTRYMPMINLIQNQIETIKQKLLGFQSVDEMIKRRTTFLTEFEQTAQGLSEVDINALKRHFSNLVSTEIVGHDMLLLMENTLRLMIAIDKILKDARPRLPSSVYEDQILEPSTRIINYLLEPRRQRNFSDQQTGDIQAELERIKRVTHLEALHQSLRNRSTVKAEEKKAIDTMEYLTKKSGRFADQDQQDFDRAMKSVEHLSTLPGLGINESERVAIVKALNMGRGHWYACPKGHPYLITECGGANQISACPECGERIGGENHALLTTNSHFGAMDGSTHPAWSNEANLNMPPRFP